MGGILQTNPNWLAEFTNSLVLAYDEQWSYTNSELTYDALCTQHTSVSAEDRVIWVPDTISLVDTGVTGGAQHMRSRMMSFEHTRKTAHSGLTLTLTKDEIEDDGIVVEGNKIAVLDWGGQWARQVGEAKAYRPQELVTNTILQGESTDLLAYDGFPLFALNRPVNYKIPGSPVFSNIFTGAASGIYPGAIPILGLSPAQAAENIAKGVAYIRSLRGTNGKPLRLKVESIVGGSELQKPLGDALDTKFVGIDGSTENTLSKYGIGYRIVEELTDPTALGTYYFKVRAPMNSQRGAVQYITREAHTIVGYSPGQDVDLGRSRIFEWICDGRDGVAVGEPHGLFKAKPT